MAIPTMYPTMAPIDFDQGLKNANRNSPYVGPPYIPLMDNAACRMPPKLAAT